MIQLYHLKRTPDVQKAERFFKERKVKYQDIDLTKHKLGARELQSILKAVGIKHLVDENSIAWKESTAQFLHAQEALIEALIAQPKLMMFPIVRDGQKATVGIVPEIWATWIS